MAGSFVQSFQCIGAAASAHRGVALYRPAHAHARCLAACHVPRCRNNRRAAQGIHRHRRTGSTSGFGRWLLRSGIIRCLAGRTKGSLARLGVDRRAVRSDRAVVFARSCRAGFHRFLERGFDAGRRRDRGGAWDRDRRAHQPHSRHGFARASRAFLPLGSGDRGWRIPPPRRVRCMPQTVPKRSARVKPTPVLSSPSTMGRSSLIRRWRREPLRAVCGSKA